MRKITERDWSERPEQADQTVNVLVALGFGIQLDFLDRKFDGHGTLVSETFTKYNADITEKVTVDYTYVRTYLCQNCNRVGLAADKYTHAEYHAGQNRHQSRRNRFTW